MASRTGYVGTESAGDVLTTTNFNKLPNGWLGDISITADSASVGATITNISGLSQAVTVGTSRKLKITFSGRISVDTDNETVDVCIRESSTTLKAYRATMPSSLVSQDVSFHVTVSPSAGSHTYLISLQRVSGSGNCAIDGASTFPSTMTIEDVGSSS